MQQKPPIRSNNPRNKLASQEKSEEREIWFKTVVKVINWKNGPKAGEKEITSEKISEKEWLNYCKQSFKINTSSLKSQTQKKLQEVEELIRKHGGFA
ncbi:MAG TPA: hypothetical protein VJG66_01595 [Patescibacteria group bacterium]|nr:hypothetical protein [Patescibacteria group bacterium]